MPSPTNFSPTTPRRTPLSHIPPPWVNAHETPIFFITISVSTPNRSKNILCANGRPQILTDATAHYHKIYRWYAHLFLVMPDHIHGLFSFPPDRASMSQTIASWKSYTAKRAGFSWQRDYFNHRLRTDESFDEKAHYIRMNPVRARLADSPDTWPHAWSPPNPR